MWQPLVAVSLSAALAGSAQRPEPPAPQGAKVWIGKEASYEEYLRTAEIVREVELDTGRTRPRRVWFATGGLAASAIAKDQPPGMVGDQFDSWMSEVAAYELDKLLGLGMVPVTVEREVGGRLGSLQLWADGCKRVADVKKRKPTIGRAWHRMVTRQRLFDTLIANTDRNAGNLLVDGGWNLILIDHSRSFGEDPLLRRLDRLLHVERDLFERLKNLDRALVQERVGPWLDDPDQMSSLLLRRNMLVEHYERLAEQRGAGAVFID